jgi:hypothetical protein
MAAEEYLKNIKFFNIYSKSAKKLGDILVILSTLMIIKKIECWFDLITAYSLWKIILLNSIERSN